MNGRRTFFLMVWAGFIFYAFSIAPDGNQGYVEQLLTMKQPDPLLMVVFCLLGIYPMTFAIVLLSEDDRRIPAWPFVVGSFMLGAFALLPYFFLSKRRVERQVRTPSVLLNFLNSTILKTLLFSGTMALMGYGMTKGSASFYREAFQQSQFVHVMTMDFFVLTFLAVFVIFSKERKHGRKNQWHWLGMIPVVGFLAYTLVEKEGSR